MNSGFSGYGTSYGTQHGGFRKFSINPSLISERSTHNSIEPQFGARYEAALRNDYKYTQEEIDRFKEEGKSPMDVFNQERGFEHETTVAKLATELQRIQNYNNEHKTKHRHTLKKHDR